MPGTDKEWSTATIDPLLIQLDNRNPRIEVGENASQDAIRLKLLELEDVLELARQIERNAGLFYGERIITTKEAKKNVVLEGNRRVAACQMLLQPSLVPQLYKLRFPQASEATKQRIRQVLADVAPDRAAAEPILTKRHTEQGAKPWSPVAKMRRAVRLLDKHSVDEVAQILGTSVTQVRKLIKPYRLLKYALNLKIWSPQERLKLEDEKLKTNPYTRFFTLKDTKEALQIHFDSDQNIISALPETIFKEQMGRIARDFLLPDPSTGKARFDTRKSAQEYFADFVKDDAEPTQSGTQKKPSSSTANTDTSSANQADARPNRPSTPKASVFFENLQCHVVDDRLIKMTDEIRAINHRKRTIAASLLLRALLECSLVYKMQQTRKWSILVAQQKTLGRDPGLADIIKFCGNFSNGVFSEQNICNQLRSHTTTQAKKYLDGITHYKYQDADSVTLESVANNLRQLITYILAGH